ncbi:MAG: imidazole glycerol phosphate synthase subunit HisH, partial [Bacteroidetes bacterium]|nr:imidazole glycerol phosphate synthase subunit HisH [Bacteroidota bacterium]
MDITIIKYNAGNVQSMIYALERLGIKPTLSDDPEVIKVSEKVIFPGVGEASTTMRYLRKNGLDKLIPALKQPVLGVCLGLQLMCA